MLHGCHIWLIKVHVVYDLCFIDQLMKANLVCKTHVFQEQEPLAEILLFMTSKSMKNSETLE